MPARTIATTNGPETKRERALARWDPVEMLETLQSEMSRFFGEGWPFDVWPPRRPLRRLFPAALVRAPRMDVFEKEGNIVVQAELPGVKKEDIELTLDDGDLLIQAERKAESEVKEQDYYRAERSMGRIYRRIPLDVEVEADQIQASLKDGVLEVRIPKSAQAKPTRHKIAIA